MSVEMHALVVHQRNTVAVGELVAHPPVSRPASDGEAAEFRHLLYDADSDASTAAFPYPTTETTR